MRAQHPLNIEPDDDEQQRRTLIGAALDKLPRQPGVDQADIERHRNRLAAIGRAPADAANHPHDQALIGVIERIKAAIDLVGGSPSHTSALRNALLTLEESPVVMNYRARAQWNPPVQQAGGRPRGSRQRAIALDLGRVFTAVTGAEPTESPPFVDLLRAVLRARGFKDISARSIARDARRLRLDAQKPSIDPQNPPPTGEQKRRRGRPPKGDAPSGG